MASGVSCDSEAFLCRHGVTPLSCTATNKARAATWLCVTRHCVKKLCGVAPQESLRFWQPLARLKTARNSVADGDEGSPHVDFLISTFSSTAADSERTADFKFLKVSADPFGDSGDGPILLWIRQAYLDLEALIEEDLKTGFTRFIILGTAGIGKSWFLVFWMIKLAAEGGCKVVMKTGLVYRILDFSDKKKPSATGSYSCFDQPVQSALDEPSNWLIIDGEQTARVGYRCHILQACSTKPNNFQEFGKNKQTRRYYMPVWSKSEVCQFLDDFEKYREDYPGINDKAAALKLYGQIGGVVRYLLPTLAEDNGLQRVNQALSEFSVDVMHVLSGAFIPDLSDWLVHIFCKKGNYRVAIYDFASTKVKNSIVRQVQLASDVKLRTLPEVTVYQPSFGVMWGVCFEALVHRRFAEGCTVAKKKVDASGNGPVEIITIEPQNVRRIGNMLQLRKALSTGIYAKPEKKTFASVDSFLGEDIFIQVFKRLSGKHGYNMNGLLRIDEQLQMSSYQLWACVPPKLFEGTGFQNYTGKLCSKDEAAWNADKFEQFVVQVEYRAQL